MTFYAGTAEKTVYDANMELPQHGLVTFTWGTDPHNAVHNAVVLEELAFMAFHSEAINPGMAPMQLELLDRHYLRKHGKNAYYGQR